MGLQGRLLPEPGAACEIGIISRVATHEHVYQIFEAKLNANYEAWFLDELRQLTLKVPALSVCRVDSKGRPIGK